MEISGPTCLIPRCLVGFTETSEDKEQPKRISQCMLGLDNRTVSSDGIGTQEGQTEGSVCTRIGILLIKPINHMFSIYSSQSTFSSMPRWSLTQPCDVGFIIPSTQIRKTGACISEANSPGFHKEGSKVLSWSQNKVGSAPQNRHPWSWALSLYRGGSREVGWGVTAEEKT